MKKSESKAEFETTSAWCRRAVLKSATAIAAAGMFSAVGAGFALAQEGPSEDLIKAAQAEGTLVYYHSSAIDATNSWTGKFTEKYGISTQNVRGPSYPLFDRWLTEERVGQHIADIVQITDATLIDAAFEEGLIANFTPTSGAGIRDNMKNDGVWYSLYLTALGIAWNTNNVTPEEDAAIQEERWNTLTNPRWKDRIATGTPAAGGSSFVYVFMFMNGLTETYGKAFIEKMAALDPVVYDSKSPMYDRLAAGEYAIVDQAAQSDMASAYLKGAPIRWIFPDPAPAALTVQAISKDAPHPNAARLFQEWAMSAEGQSAWFEFTAVMSAREDTVDPRKAENADWYKEDWYADPKTVYLDYLNDPRYLDPEKPIIAEWNAMFGR